MEKQAKDKILTVGKKQGAGVGNRRDQRKKKRQMHVNLSNFEEGLHREMKIEL